MAIKAAHVQTREIYRSLRLQPELNAQGFDTAVIVSVGCGASLACAANKKRKFKATTKSNQSCRAGRQSGKLVSCGYFLLREAGDAQWL